MIDVIVTRHKYHIVRSLPGCTVRQEGANGTVIETTVPADEDTPVFAHSGRWTVEGDDNVTVTEVFSGALIAGGNGGGGESGAWVSDTVQAEVIMPIGDDKFFCGGREVKIAGALVPGGKLTSLICGVDGDGLLRLRQYDPTSGEYKVVGLGEYVQNRTPIPGTSTPVPMWSFEDCTLVAGRDLLLDVVNDTDTWFVYVTKFGVDGCYVDGLVSLESMEVVRYDGYLVTAAFYVEQVRRWRVSSTGEPVLEQLGDKLTVCNATWFDNKAQSSVSVQPGAWKNEVMTCYLKTTVPVELDGVSWLYGQPVMVEDYTYVIALQQVDASLVLANLAYSLPQ